VSESSNLEEEIDRPQYNGPTFQKQLEDLINANCEENASDTPDFILGQYLQDCLDAYNKAVRDRREWHSTENTKGWIDK